MATGRSARDPFRIGGTKRDRKRREVWRSDRSGAINVARNSWRGGRSSRVRATPRMSVLP